MARKIVCLAVVLFFLGTSSVVSAQENLIQLKNPGFEEGKGATVAGWWNQAPNMHTRDETVFHSGKASLKLSKSDPNIFKVVYQRVPIQPGKLYQMTFWAKCENVVAGPKGAGLNCYLESNVGIFYPPGLSGTFDWQKITLTMKIPARPETNPQKSFIAFGFFKGASGTAWVDDVEVKEVGVTDAHQEKRETSSETPVGKVKVTNGGFEEVSGNKPKGWIAGSIWSIDNTVAKNGQNSLKMDTKGEYQLARQYIPIKGGQRFRISAWVKTENMTPGPSRTGCGASIWLEWYEGSKFGGGFYPRGLAGTNDWTKLSFEMDKPCAAEANKLVVEMAPNKGAQGTAWIDDVEVKEIGGAPGHTVSEEKRKEGTPVSSQGIQLKNPGFEEGKAPAISGWINQAPNMYKKDEVVFHSGKACLKLTKSDPSLHKFIYQKIPLQPGKLYRITFWAKCENVVAGPKGAGLNCYLESNVGIFYPRGISGTFDWQKITLTMTSPCRSETDPKRSFISFGFFKGATGTAWVDDVQVEEVSGTASSQGSTRQSPATSVLTGSQKSQLVVKKIDHPPKIDGTLNEFCWKEAEPVSGFVLYTNAVELANKQTQVRAAYDNAALYLGIKCDEPNPGKMSAKAKERDGKIWQDDALEIMLGASIAEYGQFVLNCKNVRYDGWVKLNPFGETIHDAKWNPEWESATKTGKDNWVAEIAIPWETLKFFPKSGDKMRLNVSRDETQLKELSSISPLVRSFHTPQKYCKLIFSENSAILKRSFATSTPFSVVRKNPVFQKVQTNPGYILKHWTWSDLNEAVQLRDSGKLSKEEFNKATHKIWDKFIDAHFMLPYLPWADNGTEWYSNREYCEKIYGAYGLKSLYYFTHGGMVRRTRERGAAIVMGTGLHGFHPLDPAVSDQLCEEIRDVSLLYKNVDYCWGFEGWDEPLLKPVPMELVKKHKIFQDWDNEIKEKYGFGKFDSPHPDTQEFHANREKQPFQWIAFNRWSSDKYIEVLRKQYEIVKKEAPTKIFIPCNLMPTIGIPPIDYDKLSHVGDIISCDPYASLIELRPGRGIFNHGFATQYIKDLTGKPIKTIVQIIKFGGYDPTPDDVREWITQAVKSGALVIDLFDSNTGGSSSYFKNPPRWEEMVRVAKLVSQMGRIKYPEKAKTAIYVSSSSMASQSWWATGDEPYTAYCLLGEKAGSWFEFVSDHQLQRGIKNLSDYKIVYVPFATYELPENVERLIDFARNGGTLIVGDPQAFEWNIDGTKTGNIREKLVGAKIVAPIQDEKVNAISIVNQDVLLKGYAGSQELPIYGRFRVADDHYHYASPARVNNRFGLKIEANNTVVLGKFSDGKPAIILRNFEKGKVLYFAANPFVADAVSESSAWGDFFKVVQKNAGVKVDLPIWRFEIPPPNFPYFLSR